MEKKYIILIIILLISISLWIYWKFFMFIDLNKIEIKSDNNQIEFNDKQIIDNNLWYNYYQAYIYPEEYSVECTNNNIVCDKIIKDKNEISKFLLNFTWKNIDNKNIDNIKLDINFMDKEKNIQTLKNIFLSIYNKEIDKKTIAKDGKTIMQNICEQSVADSIPAWTADYEEMIQKKILETCEGTEKIDNTKIIFLWMNGDEAWSIVKIKINISKLKILYKFFKKENNDFIEKQKQEKFINSSIILEWDILLSNL